MDHILYWNDVALEANRKDFTDIPPGENKPRPEQGGPTLSSRALAIVHLAMYDAHAGVVNTPGLPRYMNTPPNPASGASAAAAVASAAHTTLCKLFPRQKSIFDTKLQSAGLAGPGVNEGQAFGRAVGEAMMVDRANDPGAGDAGYTAPTNPGGHRVDPLNAGQSYHAPFYGARSKCFAVTERHALKAPPALDSLEYLHALRQVRGKGIRPELMGTLPTALHKRTVDETLIGIFWAYDGPRELGTPPRLYNLIVRAVAMQKKNNVNDNARLFAFVNAAMGDAGILAWDQKYIHNFWRPVVGIREHDASMGPAGSQPTDNISDDCDPLWEPLGAPASNSSDRNFTPPFPAYPSGHATFGAAAFHIVRLFYGVAPGDRRSDAVFNGPFVSDELNGNSTDNAGNKRPKHSRKFSEGLWQMIVENGLSRVYLGVHWFFDAFALDASNRPDLTQRIGGVPLGLRIAEDIFAAGGGKAPKKSAVLPRSSERTT